jgi:ABC-type branched-subunit amino acid transport system ATPase component/ABC-type branched-subunit amino acid transport system permease subunit
MSSAAVKNRIAARGLPAAVVTGLLVLGLLLFGRSAGDYYGDIAITTFLMIILALGVRLLLLAGESSLGHGLFYAMGAYTVAIMTTKHGVPFSLAALAGGVVAALGALVIGIPSLRTSGAYFFLMSFGALVVGMSIISNWRNFTGGFAGISGIPAPGGLIAVRDWFFLTLVLVIVVIGIFFLFERSRWGLELRAVGGSRDLAQSIGVNPFRALLTAFVVGAFFAGIAGGFYASYISFIAPTSFTIWLSTYVLMYVILGGSRFFVGAIVGAAVLTLLPTLESFSQEYVGMFVPAVVLVIFMAAPRGVVSAAMELSGRAGVRRKPSLRYADAPAGAKEQQRRVQIDVPAGAELLRVDGVAKRFGGLQALESVDFDVRAGEILGIIGPNGAGKTTLFNIISGFASPSAGSVTFAGRPLTGASPSDVVSRGLTRTFQHSAVFEKLTVLENVVVACREPKRPWLLRALVPVRRDKKALAQARQVLESFGLDAYGDTEADALPYGARKRLGVAIAMATGPSLICLDEPMAGLSDVEVEEMSGLLEQLKAQHDVTIVLIEHRISAIMRLCDRVVALDFGRVIAEGAPRDVARDPAVVEAYLGGELSEAASV